MQPRKATVTVHTTPSMSYTFDVEITPEMRRRAREAEQVFAQAQEIEQVIDASGCVDLIEDDE